MTNNDQSLKKKPGRPKKNIDYDSTQVVEFLQLFGDFNSWEDAEGKVIKYSDLQERQIYDKYIEKEIHQKLKEVLPISKFRKLKYHDKINNVNDLIDLLRSIGKKRRINVISMFSSKQEENTKVILFNKIIDDK